MAFVNVMDQFQFVFFQTFLELVENGRAVTVANPSCWTLQINKKVGKSIFQKRLLLNLKIISNVNIKIDILYYGIKLFKVRERKGLCF